MDNKLYYTYCIIIRLNNRKNFSRLSDRLSELSTVAVNSPPKKYSDTVAELLSFINNAESVLLSEHAVVSDHESMEKQRCRFEGLQKTLKEFENKFKYVNTTGQELIGKISDESLAQRLRDELQDLNTKWSDIPVILDERQQKLSKGKLIKLLFHCKKI